MVLLTYIVDGFAHQERFRGGLSAASNTCVRDAMERTERNIKNYKIYFDIVKETT